MKIKYLILLGFFLFSKIALANGTSYLSSLSKMDLNNLRSEDFYFGNGFTNVQKGEYDKAITNFSICLLVNSNDLRALYGLGNSYFAKGDLDNALATYNHIIHIAPDESIAFLNRGNIYRSRNQFIRAISDFNDSININPTNDAAYKYRASGYFNIGFYTNAIDDYTKGLNLNSHDAVAWANRADSYLKIHQYDKAVGDYKMAILVDSNDYNSYNNIAWFRATSAVASERNGSEAVKYATEACELTKWKNWKCIDTLAAAYAESGDYDKAIDYEKRAIKIDGVADDLILTMNNRLLIYQAKRAYRDN